MSKLFEYYSNNRYSVYSPTTKSAWRGGAALSAASSPPPPTTSSSTRAGTTNGCQLFDRTTATPARRLHFEWSDSVPPPDATERRDKWVVQFLGASAADGDLWLHVDACWGGSAAFSPRQRHLMAGSQRADSIAWNPHKMLGAPLQAAAFVTRHAGLLHATNAAAATYLFQRDKFYDVSYDTGDKAVQCGRKVDGFKLWFMLRARGETQVAALVDNAFRQAAFFHELVLATPGFRPAFDFGFNCTNVCFFYVPAAMRGEEETEEWWDNLSAVAPSLKERMIKSGSVMIGYQPLAHKAKVNFFRMVVHCQPPPTEADMKFVISEMERHGNSL